MPTPESRLNPINANSASGGGSLRAPTHRAGPNASVPLDGALMKLDVELLDENPFQPRTAIDEAQLGDLAASIAMSGLLQPVVVRPGQPGRYHIVAGHRRVAAFRKLKDEAATDEERRKFRLIPAHVKRDLDDSQMAVGAYVENVQREALSPWKRRRPWLGSKTWSESLLRRRWRSPWANPSGACVVCFA
jgi:hypothetical protein